VFPSKARIAGGSDAIALEGVAGVGGVPVPRNISTEKKNIDISVSYRPTRLGKIKWIA
jgi:hypothetical protein